MIEIAIGLYVHDTIIRPYIGDLLISVFLYCAIKSLANLPVFKTAMAVLFFCYAIEISQHFHLVVHLGLQSSRVARILLGTYFSWIDMLCYTIGITGVLIVEFMETGRFSRQLSA